MTNSSKLYEKGLLQGGCYLNYEVTSKESRESIAVTKCERIGGQCHARDRNKNT